MSDKKAVAKKALRQLHAVLVNKLDPDFKDEFYANDLLGSSEMQKIEAASTPNEKNNCLLAGLKRRDDEAKVMDTLIRLLEGEDKETKVLNKKLLQKIEEG